MEKYSPCVRGLCAGSLSVRVVVVVWRQEATSTCSAKFRMMVMYFNNDESHRLLVAVQVCKTGCGNLCIKSVDNIVTVTFLIWMIDRPSVNVSAGCRGAVGCCL